MTASMRLINPACCRRPAILPRMRGCRRTGASLNQVVLTQGFIAANAGGDTVLLGRGGSDTSAAYFAAKLNAMRLEIWTDVPGLFSANPNVVPEARLLRALHYDEAQEIASNGAKILHPRCVLPVRQYKIPLHVYATQAPGLEGHGGRRQCRQQRGRRSKPSPSRRASPGLHGKPRHVASGRFPGGRLSGVQAAWPVGGSGIDLGDQCHGVPGSHRQYLDPRRSKHLAAALGKLCRVEILGPCASLSLLGHNIRGILHELGSAFELFQDQKIYLVTQAANDLNFTFVIDEAQGDRLVQQLHERLIQSIGFDKVLGPTWLQLFGRQGCACRASGGLVGAAAEARALHRHCAARIRGLRLRHGDSGCGIAAVLRVRSVKRWAYAMKANWHPEILREFYAAGLILECVSRARTRACFRHVPGLTPTTCCSRPISRRAAEYEFGFAKGVRVTLDNLHPLKMWPEVFRGKEIFLRIDPGFGRGHHQSCAHRGVHSKFGIPISEADELVAVARRGTCA
jgi:diaminopimelate decarboxylase/aspartate kinase